MSCRALGREIENYFLNFIVIDLKKNHKIKKIKALYKKSEKNNLIKKFFNKNFSKEIKTSNYYCNTNKKFKSVEYKLMSVNEK